MKELFPGYYRPSPDDFKEIWKNSTFILDANVLLNLYRYDEATRNDFLNTLKKIESRLWLPHQVALEYQENRHQVIKSEAKRVERIQSDLDELKSNISTKLNNYPSISSEKFFVKLDQISEEFIEEIRSSLFHVKPDEMDFIRNQLDDLFKGKVGSPPKNQRELDLIYEEGNERYKIKYPPGFKDNDKKDNYLYERLVIKQKYGDLILWKQILESAKAKKWNHVVFLTDDDKEDWWREEKGETVGARPELVKEIFDIGVSFFYMYNSERFLYFAKEYIQADIKEESIRQVEHVAEFQRSLSRKPTSVSKWDLLNPYLRGHVAGIAFGSWLKNNYPNLQIKKELDGPLDYALFNEKDNILLAGFQVKAFSSRRSPRALFLNVLNELNASYGVLNLEKIYLVAVVEKRLSRVFIDFIRYFEELKDGELKHVDLIVGDTNLDEFLSTVHDSSGLDSSILLELSLTQVKFQPLYSSDPEISVKVDSVKVDNSEFESQ
jgi:hypothetical protein